MLKDSFGRIHDYLRVSLTDRCNFRCLYCLPEPEHHENRIDKAGCASHSDKMNASELISICKIFVEAGVKKIRLTGGEPLVRKDAGEILEELGKLPVKLAITTNGSRIHHFMQAIESSGIRSVNISLDSLNAENFNRLTGKNEFDIVLSNINNLIENNFHVKINMVVMKGQNDHEIIDFVRWTHKVPVHIRFIEFMPFPGNKWKPEKVITYREILDIISSEFLETEKLDDNVNDTTKKHRVKNFAGTFAVISTMSEPFCSGCNRMRLTADGKMRNCLFGKTEMDLLTSYRNGINILPMIKNSLHGKHFQLGGNEGELWGLSETLPGKRTMMGIGG